MAKIVDLSVLAQEPLQIKMPHCDDVFTIPGEVSTNFVFNLYKMYEDMNNKDIDEIEKIKIVKKIVIEILKLDKENAKKINMKYIDDNLDSITYLNTIIQAMMEHITEIQEDENLNSPKSDK